MPYLSQEIAPFHAILRGRRRHPAAPGSPSKEFAIASLRFGAIVQARLTSARLPGKVLRPLNGRPMLGYLIERLRHASAIDDIVVATSIDPSDDDLARYCEAEGVHCFRGPLADVAARFRGTVDRYGFDAFVRLCGDSPLLDQRIVDRAVERFGDARPDLVTNKVPKTFPAGQSVEVVDAGAFRRACDAMSADDEREHVTPFFYRHPDRFRIVSVQSPRDFGALHLAVDTADDFARAAAIISRMDRPHWEYDLSEIADLASCTP